MPAKGDVGNSQDLVVIKEIRQNTVVLANGGLRQIIMVGGLNFALKSEAEQNIITGSYQNFLNGVDFPLQVVIRSRKVNIDDYLENLSRRKEIEQSPLLQNQIGEYVEFVKGFVQKNAIMEKTFFVVVPFFPAGLGQGQESVSKMIPFFGGKKTGKSAEAAAAKSAEAAEQEFQENLIQLNQRVSQAVGGLFTVGLEAIVLNDEQLIELFYNVYNPQTIEKQKINLPGQTQ